MSYLFLSCTEIFITELKEKIALYCPDVELDLIFSSTDKKALNLQKNSIKIMNVESSKGLEFPHVFFVGLDYMPRIGENRDIDSERKLAYVGMTRAQNKLFILGCENTGFLSDIKEIQQRATIQSNENKVSNNIVVETASLEVLTIDHDEIDTSTDAMIGQKWSEDEEVKLIDAFMEEKLSIKDIAQRHQRKEGGIRSRLKNSGSLISYAVNEIYFGIPFFSLIQLIALIY